jgi:hypothetical protein
MLGLSSTVSHDRPGEQSRGGPGRAGGSLAPNREALRAGVPGPKVCRKRDSSEMRLHIALLESHQGKPWALHGARGFESHPTAVTLAIPL